MFTSIECSYHSRIVTVLVLLLLSVPSKGQDNYEIQVYGAETVKQKRTMVELHSNYTISGIKTTENGQYPDNHIIHETIEITHGWTPWFETGFYLFNAIGSEGRTNYVGTHVRPRVAAPEHWHWPVGVSLSVEYGFQKKEYSANTNTLEIRPIVDKKWNKVYVALNPALDKSFAGPDAKRGFLFSPNVKGSYDLNKLFALGIEYYGSVGPFFHYDAFRQQQQQIFAATDINFNPEWEFNAGIGLGFTNSTDKGIIKFILGRRI